MIFKTTQKIPEKMSVIGIGCWNMGGDWDCSDDNNSARVILEAVDKGVNLFDVAPVYGWGNSERILGKVLKEYGLRQRVLLASKGGLLWDKNHQTRNNLSKESLLTEIDESLKRLQTDHIDIYQMHWPDHNTPLEETAEALYQMKKSGKIRYVGLSNFSQKDMETMNQYISVDCQQSLYNMLERNPRSYHGIPLEYKTEQEVFPKVREYGQAFLPYSPLFQGLLAGKFLDKVDFSKRDIRNANPKLSGETFLVYQKAARELKLLADRIGRSLNELAFNWLIQKQEITTVIGGVASVGQLEQNLRCLDWQLTEGELKEIDRIIQPFEFMG